MTHTNAHFPVPHNAARNMMLGQLFTNDIGNKNILRAMTDVPREPFLPEHLRGAAYVDDDLSVGNGRALIAPLTFAKLLDLAEITPSARVLVVGCLNGYTAAVVAHLAAHVTAIDTDEHAIAEARAHMAQLHLHNVSVRSVATLSDGYAQDAPYDAIIVCGAIRTVPETLASQLSTQGRLTAIRTKNGGALTNGTGRGIVVTRAEGILQCREHFDAAAALLPGFADEPAFAF